MLHSEIVYTGPDDSAETIQSIYETYLLAATEKIGKEAGTRVEGRATEAPLIGSWQPSQPEYGGSAELLPTLAAMQKIGAAPSRLNIDGDMAAGSAEWPALFALDPYTLAWATIDSAVREVVVAGAAIDKVTVTLTVPAEPALDAATVGRWVRWAQGAHDCALAYRTPILAVEYGAGFAVEAFGRIVQQPAQKPVTGDAIYVVGNTAAEMAGSAYAELHGEPGGLVPDALTEGLMRYRSVARAVKAGHIRALVPLGHGGLSGGLGRYLREFDTGLVLKLNDVLATVAHDDLLLFSESIGRILLIVGADDVHSFELTIAAESFGRIGTVNADRQLTIVGYEGDILIDEPVSTIYQLE